MGDTLSAAAVVVLRDLDRARPRDVLKAGIKELLACGALRVERQAGSGLRRRGRARMFLLPGAGVAPPRQPLPAVLALVLAVPASRSSGVPGGRELGALGKALARSPDTARLVPDLLAALTAAGYTERTESRVLGIFRRVRHERTEGGHRALAGQWRAGDPYRRRRGESDEWDDDRRDAGGAVVLGGDVDDDLDGAFDGSFDSAFDSSFDSAFDAAFDSGFDAGGGDGGGGDGGGGDGGGGGGD